MCKNNPLVLIASAMQLWFLSSQIATSAAPAVPKTRKKTNISSQHGQNNYVLANKPNLGSANLGVGDATVHWIS